MNNEDTPLTNEASFGWMFCEDGNKYVNDFFAQKLEREINRLNSKIEAMSKQQREDTAELESQDKAIEAMKLAGVHLRCMASKKNKARWDAAVALTETKGI